MGNRLRTRGNRLRRAAAALLLFLSATGTVSAQLAPTSGIDFQPEFRADLLVRGATALELGAGLIASAGYYARIAVDAAAGTEWHNGRAGSSARVDATTRFLLDPFGELPWGAYGGGGVSLRWSEREQAQGYLLLVAGVEGPARGGWRPAVELGLGGGVRLGVVLRRARNSAR